MNFELNGMTELNEQELMMVDGGKIKFTIKLPTIKELIAIIFKPGDSI